MATRKVNYDNASPWAETDIYRLGLDVMTHRPIPRLAEDKLYEIDAEFNLRPDLLAFKLYGTSKLWWVFAARNPSALKDPLYDFATGNRIFLPTKQTLNAALGI